jgi:hypothetical protein
MYRRDVLARLPYPLTKDATITRAVAKAGRIIPLTILRGLHHDTPEYDLR